MARSKGKVSLKETVPEDEIVKLGEVKNEPNYIMPDGLYGISGGYMDYSLVKKRIAYRTGNTDDAENEGKVIEYTTWEDVPCYKSTLQGIFEAYAKILNLSEFKRKKLMQSISDLIEINKKTKDKIYKSIGNYDVLFTNEQNDILSLLDKKESLLKDINDLQDIKEEYVKSLNDLEQLKNEIKERRKIIVQDMPKQKKHRLKLEEE